MILKAINNIDKKRLSEQVDSITIEFDNGKEMEINKDETGSVYMICRCGNFIIKKKTENMFYIELK